MMNIDPHGFEKSLSEEPALVPTDPHGLEKQVELSKDGTSPVKHRANVIKETAFSPVRIPSTTNLTKPTNPANPTASHQLHGQARVQSELARGCSGGAAAVRNRVRKVAPSRTRRSVAEQWDAGRAWADVVRSSHLSFSSRTAWPKGLLYLAKTDGAIARFEKLLNAGSNISFE